MKLGENVIGASPHSPFFPVAPGAGPTPPRPRHRGGDALRTAARTLSGFQKEALVASARTGRTWRLVSDEGPYLNGHDAAPCPLAFMSVGMAAGYMNEILALAERRGAALRRLRLVQDNFYTMQGSMQRRTMVGGAENVALRVEVDCDLDDAALAALLQDAIAAAPVNGLVRGRLPSLFRLARNGAPLSTGAAAEMTAPLADDPAPLFAAAAPAAEAPDLVAPAGLTPRKAVEKGTAAGGSSLTDQQDRRLNIGAVAELRPDGIKEIRQMQYSPHGTSFRFLSSEDGRAPDAATLISAGIAFCFMTQFGRFVSMLKLDLADCMIVQDTQFSAGGASGGTGAPGGADPVETHVFLTTGETGETAREMLDIAEKTCFLHALFRTDLRTRLTVARL